MVLPLQSIGVEPAEWCVTVMWCDHRVMIWHFITVNTQYRSLWNNRPTYRLSRCVLHIAQLPAPVI